MSEPSNQSSSNKAEFFIRVTGRPGAHGDDWNVIEVPLKIIPGDIPLGVVVEYDKDRRTLTLSQRYAGRESALRHEIKGDFHAVYGHNTGRVYTIKVSNYRSDSKISPLWKEVREAISAHTNARGRISGNMDFFSEILQSSLSKFRRFRDAGFSPAKETDIQQAQA